MRSEELVFEKYDTDKITHQYLQWYDPQFEPLVKSKIKLLELGILKGGSLMLWHDYFPEGMIVGIDLFLPENFAHDKRIKMFQGSQDDPVFLTEVAKKTAPEGYDIIIDDASHIAEPTRVSFWHLFENHLKPSGLYVIEDWGTGYWDDWVDGKMYDPTPDPAYIDPTAKIPSPNHSYGMVGLIKELVDEVGAGDLTRGRMTDKPKRSSKFESVVITPAMVFIKKKPV